jgi:hypothetical protein
MNNGDADWDTISRNYLDALFLRGGSAALRESIRLNEPELLNDPEAMEMLSSLERREAGGESRASIVGLIG